MFEIIRDMPRRPRKVVVASSQAVYGEGKYFCQACQQPRYPTPRRDDQLVAGRWEMECPVCASEMRPIPTDEVRVDPRTPYAMSKYAQEMIAINVGRSFGIPTVALRYSVTYGPRQSIFNPYTGVCSIFSTRLLNDLPPVVYEDGRQARDFVYVEDVARANLLVADKDESEASNYQVYNVGTGRPTNVLRFIELLADLYRKPATTIQRGEFRPGEVRHLFADNSRIRALGWEPTVPVEEGLRRYAAWIAGQKDIRDYFGEAEALMKRTQVVRQSRAGAWAVA
jgi:dTDP-L-rhamnose 4-epimerase